MASGDAVTLEASRWQVLCCAARSTPCQRLLKPTTAELAARRISPHRSTSARPDIRIKRRERQAASAPSNRQLARAAVRQRTAARAADGARVGDHGVLAADEDGALLRRAAGYHRRVARLLAGRTDRDERLDHRVLAMRSRAGPRVRSAARVGRSGCGAREWTRVEPVELTAPESMAALKRYRGPRGP